MSADLEPRRRRSRHRRLSEWTGFIVATAAGLLALSVGAVAWFIS